jgi:hypothetical protein
VESFNSSPFLFCIVNTGPGKEAADRSLESESSVGTVLF